MREPATSTFPSVQAFVREGREGVCPLCDEKMPPRKPGANPGRLRVHCGSKDCARLYQTLAARDLRARGAKR